REASLAPFSLVGTIMETARTIALVMALFSMSTSDLATRGEAGTLVPRPPSSLRRGAPKRQMRGMRVKELRSSPEERIAAQRDELREALEAIRGRSQEKLAE